MEQSAPAVEPARILIVDDEPAAADGTAALARVAAGLPDLIILDVLMPRMDGPTACRHLRAHGAIMPVLMLTARDMVGDRVTGLDAGADDYLAKPFVARAVDECGGTVRLGPPRAAAPSPACTSPAPLTVPTSVRGPEVGRLGGGPADSGSGEGVASNRRTDWKPE